MGFWRNNDNRHMLLDESGNCYVGQDNVGTTVAVRAEDFEAKRYNNPLARNVAWWQTFHPELIVQNEEK